MRFQYTSVASTPPRATKRFASIAIIYPFNSAEFAKAHDATRSRWWQAETRVNWQVSCALLLSDYQNLEEKRVTIIFKTTCMRLVMTFTWWSIVFNLSATWDIKIVHCRDGSPWISYLTIGGCGSSDTLSPLSLFCSLLPSPFRGKITL